MSLITKAIATEVAIKLTARKESEIKKLEKSLKDTFTEMYLKTIPDEILKTYESFPSYFEVRTEFQLSGNGSNYQYVKVNKPLPFSKRTFEPTEKQAVKLIEAYNIIQDKIKIRRELVNEIEVTLNSLRSYKRIKELFPEAAPFLPEKITTSLALNISDLQSRLNG